MNHMTTTIRCLIKVISPVHLGCDEVYEPMGFAVDESNQRLVVFDPVDFLADLDEGNRKKFSTICLQGTISSILEIYGFVRRHSFSTRGRHVEVCPGFVDHYDQTLSIPKKNERKVAQELNNFIISRTAFLSDTQRPYLPGSAVKGAIRTAYLNLQAKKNRVPKPSGKHLGKELEKSLLKYSDIPLDPFRMVKVSDFLPVGEVKTKIVYAVNQKKNPSQHKARGPQQILEVIEPGALFVGTVTVTRPEKGSGIKNPITMADLQESIRSFYRREKEREDRELAQIALRGAPVDKADGEMLLRLGRHSGAESVTIEGYRRIRIMKGKGQQPGTLDRSTTFWLASDQRKPTTIRGLRPFGWSLMREVTTELEEQLQEQEAEFSRNQRSPVSENQHVSSSGSLKRDDEQGFESLTVATPKTQPWQKAVLTWTPGDGMLTAEWQGKTATIKGKELVPEVLHAKLFKKKKKVTANVTVEVLGENYFKIVSIGPDA